VEETVMSKLQSTAFLFLIFSMLTANGSGFQESSSNTEIRLDEQTKKVVVEKIGQLLMDKYIDLDVAKKTKEHLLGRLKSSDPVYEMIPISETLFALAELDDFRVQFELDSEGKVTGLVGLTSDGYRDPSKRD
jgi:hypothetical protein